MQASARVQAPRPAAAQGTSRSSVSTSSAASASNLSNLSRRPAGRQAQLIALQKSAGNQAVQRLVRTDRHAGVSLVSASTSESTSASVNASVSAPSTDTALAVPRAAEAAASPAVVAAPRITSLAKPVAQGTHLQAHWYNVDIPFTDYQFDPSLAGVKTAAGVVKDAAVSGLEWMAEKVEGLVDSGIAVLSERWESIKDFAASALDGAKRSFVDILALMKSPLGLLADTLMSLDAQAIDRAWRRFSGLISSVANGFKAMADGLLAQVGRLWSGIDGIATSVLDRIASVTGNFLFRKLPDALQNVANAAVSRLKSVWKGISDKFTRLLKEAKEWVDQALDKVFGFVRKVLGFGFDVVVNGILQFAQVVLFMKDLLADPRKYVDILARRGVQAFEGVESRFAGVVDGHFGRAATPLVAPAGGPAVTVHRSPQPGGSAERRRSATWGEIGHGVSQTMGRKWTEFKSNPMSIVTGLLLDMIVPLYGDVKDLIQLFKDIRRIATGPLGAGSLEEFWTSLLLLLDIPMLIYHTVVSILMRSLMLPLIVASFVPHPVVKGIAAAVGYVLLGAFLQGELANLQHKTLLLKTGSTSEGQKEEAYNRIADSLVALAMTAVVMVVMLILHFMANVLKGVYSFIKGRVFPVEPTPAAAVESAAAEGTKPKTPEGEGTRPKGRGEEGIPSKDGRRRVRLNEEGRCEICASPCQDIRRRYESVMTPEIEARIKAVEENPRLSEQEQLEALDSIDDELLDLWKKAPTQKVIRMGSAADIAATEPEAVGNRVQWKLFDQVSKAEFSDVSVDMTDPARPGPPDQYLLPKSARAVDGSKVTLEADFRFTDESLIKNKETWEKKFGRELTEYGGSLGDDNLANFQKEFDGIRRANPGLDTQQIGDLAIRKVSFGKGRIRIGYGDLSVKMDGFGDVTLAQKDGPGIQAKNVPTKVAVQAGKTKP